MNRLILLTLPLLTSLLVLGGRPPRAESGPGEVAAGTLRIPVIGPIESLDPPRASSDAARLAVVNLFDQLYEYHPLRRPYEVVPALAAGLPEISEDGKHQTIRLRSGVAYSPDACLAGQADRCVTAEDVVFCLKRLMDAQTGSPGQWMLMGRIVGLDAFVTASKAVPPESHRHAYRTADGYPEVPGLEVLDDLTLRIHLLEPMPELMWLLAGGWFSIYPPEAVRVYGSRLGKQIVATGPYRIVMFLAGQRLVLRANPRYRKEAFPVAEEDEEDDVLLQAAGSPLPRNAVVELLSYDSELVAWQAFLRGEVDVAQVPRDAFTAAVDVNTGKLLPHLAKRGTRLLRAARPEIHYDAFNMRDPVVGTPAGEKGRAIRRAICLAADDGWALTRLYRNRSERVFGPLLPEFRGFDPDFVNDWLRQEGESREDALELARSTLADAGLAEGKGVPELKMHILDDETSGRLFTILQRQIAELGIHLVSVRVSWATLQKVLRARQAQLFSSSWYADYPDAQNFLQLFYSRNAPEPNYSGYASEAYDKLYDEARLLPAGEDPEDIYGEMQKVLVQDCPWRFRLRRIRWSAIQSWLRGYRYNEFAPKYFKYCRVDEAERKQAIAGWE